MTKAVRLEREGVLAGIQDPLVVSLSEARFKCCDEVGYEKDADICNPLKPRCPVRDKCNRLWRTVANTISHNLKLAEYRRLSQRFHLLKQERDRLLGLRPSPDEPAKDTLRHP